MSDLAFGLTFMGVTFSVVALCYHVEIMKHRREPIIRPKQRLIQPK